MSDESSRPARLRLASFSDAESLTDMRFEWDQPGISPTEEERTSFTGSSRDGGSRRSFGVCAPSPRSTVSSLGGAWLLLHERVPNPPRFGRAGGDIQSVYFRPKYRRTGIGRDLVRLLLAEGERRGISRFTVDSNDHALRLYQGEGFVRSHLRLERTRTLGTS
ncbi:GNAT family N-acetyltransferase [Microbacterium proteolyticum]|uniref:GNAT family N-acetyltransferase n=1 Tax=Microbacterium proteolyticum TaxID=1572644 RepID=UPI001FABC813|nr:GNAT family N-acetyltransferase [Microbacterium proteolyticum]MCI9859634.1 GNAT family N-acetyltransferase [Microbacterium proteolyticum]